MEPFSGSLEYRNPSQVIMSQIFTKIQNKQKENKRQTLCLFDLVLAALELLDDSQVETCEDNDITFISVANS